ncbi:glycosyltransferase family 4 protein [bacterium]|nr:glycosyltransferase family 4 protein [bacterium]
MNNKKINVGIAAADFMTWNGGVDFLKDIILGLEAVADEFNFELYLLEAPNKDYRNYKGLKRIFKKFQSNYFTPIKKHDENKDFKEFKKLKFISFSPNKLKQVIKKYKIDVIVPCLPTKYLELDIPTIGYLYDCQCKYYPEFFSKKVIKKTEKFFKKNLDTGKRIVVNSHDTKKDILKFYKAKDENILVLPFSPKINERYLEDYSEEIKKYNLPKKYFMISNQFWKHKNHKTAFEAISKLVKEDLYKDVQLICTGPMEDDRAPEHIKELKEFIKNNQLENTIRCLGMIPKAEQLEIMKHAQALIQPTLFEGDPGAGAGWSAISLGVPCIFSDISVNLEIQGHPLVTYFKALDVDDLTEKMKEALSKKRIYPSKEELLKNSNDNIHKLGTFVAQAISKELAK